MQYICDDVLEMKAVGHVYRFHARITRDVEMRVDASLYGKEPERKAALFVDAHLEIFRDGKKLGEGTSSEKNPFSLEPVKTDLKDRPNHDYEHFGDAIQSVEPRFVFPIKWAKNEAETYASWIKRCTEQGTTEAAKAYLEEEKVKAQKDHVQSLKSIIFSCELIRNADGRIPSHSEAVRIITKRYSWMAANHGSYGWEDYEKAVAELEQLGETYPGKDKQPAKSVTLKTVGGLAKLTVTESGWQLATSEYGDPNPHGPFYLTNDNPVLITEGVRNMLAYLMKLHTGYDIRKEVGYLYMKGASDEDLRIWADQGRQISLKQPGRIS